MNFTVRDYRPDDFLTLWQIDQSCFEPGIAYSKYELKHYIRRTRAFSLVAERVASGGGWKQTAEPAAARVLGFLVAERTTSSGHVITIDVLAEARRSSVGSALLKEAEIRFSRLGCRRIRLETAVDNVQALAFYSRHQFRVVGTAPRYYSNGLDALVLEKQLLSAVRSDTVPR